VTDLLACGVCIKSALLLLFTIVVFDLGDVRTSFWLKNVEPSEEFGPGVNDKV
jgi:hypothetical protein